MKPITDWLKSLVSNDARRQLRRKTPPLAAYFWDGGNPVAHTVQNISPTGFYLATKERWLLGTLIMMTLQRTSGDPSKPDCSIIVMSKVIRYGEDGVGFVFIPVETSSSAHPQGPGAHAADKRTLERFLHLLESDEGYAHFGYVLFLLLLLLASTRGRSEIELVLGMTLTVMAIRSGIEPAFLGKPGSISRKRK